MAIIIKINDTDRTNLILPDSLTIADDIFSKKGECFFAYNKYGSRDFVPSGENLVEGWDGATKIFKGKAREINKVMKDVKVETFEVVCQDRKSDLDNLRVNETYENQTVNDIVADLVSKYASGFTANVDCSSVISKIEFENIPLSSCLDKLAELTDYYWYLDPDDIIQFFASGVKTAPFNLTDTNGKYIFKSLEIKENYSEIRNRVTIKNEDISYTANDIPSQTAYGIREVIRLDGRITTLAGAQQMAEAIVSQYKDPFYEGKFQTIEAGLHSGQKINIQSDIRNLNKDFIIKSVNFRMKTPNDFIYEVEVMTRKWAGLVDVLQDTLIEKEHKEIFIGDRQWMHDLLFEADGYNKIKWSAGTIRLSDGSYYNIDAGNTGVITEINIIYLQPSVSETVLQKSTTLSDGIGPGKIALGYAKPSDDIEEEASFFPVFWGKGVSIPGGNIAAKTVLAEQLSVNELSAITGNLGSINSGMMNVGATGFIRGGQTGWNIGIGFFLGWWLDAHKFSIGNPAGEYMLWTGSGMKFRGAFETPYPINVGAYATANLPEPIVDTGFNDPSNNS